MKKKWLIMREGEYALVDVECKGSKTRIAIHKMYRIYKQEYFEFDKKMTVNQAREVVDKLLFIMNL